MTRYTRTHLLFRAMLSGILLLGGASLAFAEVCLSPYVKQRTGQEKYMYVWSVDADAKDNDFLAVIDVNLASPTYGKILTTIDVGSKANEPHHFGFTDDRTKIWAGTLFSNKIFIFDVASDPARPKIVKTLDDLGKTTGMMGPHTHYALPGRMLISFLSKADGGLPGGMAEFTNDGQFIRAIPNPESAPYAYDLAVKPDLNLMVTSSFVPYRNYSKPLSQWDMKDGGNTLLVWDFKERKLLQTLTTGPTPLEVRWSLKPKAAYGFTNAALDDSLWMFKRTNGKFTTKKAADLGKGCLPADLRQSPDDKYLYVSCFLKNEIQVWDVSKPETIKLHDTVVPGVQPNMMHVTSDGKRMYISNSLLSTMDQVDRFWVRLAHVGPDGKVKMDPFFNVSFMDFQSGPARAHDMLLY
jgi:selenium-binding protein 1